MGSRIYYNFVIRELRDAAQLHEMGVGNVGFAGRPCANQVAAIMVLQGATTPPEKLSSGGGMNTNFLASIFLLFLSYIL